MAMMMLRVHGLIFWRAFSDDADDKLLSAIQVCCDHTCVDAMFLHDVHRVHEEGVVLVIHGHDVEQLCPAW
jgi:hypothetical protein